MERVRVPSVAVMVKVGPKLATASCATRKSAAAVDPDSKAAAVILPASVATSGDRTRRTSLIDWPVASSRVVLARPRPAIRASRT